MLAGQSVHVASQPVAANERIEEIVQLSVQQRTAVGVATATSVVVAAELGADSRRMCSMMVAQVMEWTRWTWYSSRLSDNTASDGHEAVEPKSPSAPGQGMLSDGQQFGHTPSTSPYRVEN